MLEASCAEVVQMVFNITPKIEPTFGRRGTKNKKPDSLVQLRPPMSMRVFCKMLNELFKDGAY